MDVSYRRDKDHNYMILDAPGELTGEEYQVRMLVGNHIPHLLKCNLRMMDGKAVFFYEITGMQPMFRVFEKRQINQEEMVELLQDIKEALENTQRYLLDGNQLLFEPEFLFFHTQTREWNLCYLPTYDGNMTESFRKLSEYLLKRLDHSDEQAVMLGYEVYSQASEENYRISEVLQTIYQVGRKNHACEEEQTEDIRASENMKLLKESAVSEQENFEDLCSEDSFFEQEESEYTIPENIGKTQTAKQKEKNISKKENILQSRKKTDRYENQAEQKKESRNEKAAKGKKQVGNEKQVQKQKTTADKKVNEHKRTSRHRKLASYKKYAGYVVIFILLAAVAAVLVKSEVLSTVQAGGILFLAAGVFIYAAGIQKEDSTKGERKKSQVSDDFDEEMGTCILQQGKNIKMAVLVSLNPEEYVNILLYREETRIGKEGRQADVCIERDVISRVHAKILRREEEYFLMDLDSTNGTYINGKRLTGDDMEKLQQGDRVSFADLEYIFQLQ